jgi:hypothetical protein
MYCPACGVELTHGLKYCNRCGASLGRDSSETSRGFNPFVLMIPIAIVSIVGLMRLFSTLNNLAGRLDAKAITAIALCGGLTVFGVVAALIWLSLRLIEGPKSHAPRARGKNVPTEIGELVMAQLSPSPNAMPSVTEGTTRNIDQIRQAERNTR